MYHNLRRIKNGEVCFSYAGNLIITPGLKFYEKSYFQYHEYYSTDTVTDVFSYRICSLRYFLISVIDNKYNIHLL